MSMQVKLKNYPGFGCQKCHKIVAKLIENGAPKEEAQKSLKGILEVATNMNPKLSHEEAADLLYKQISLYQL